MPSSETAVAPRSRAGSIQSGISLSSARADGMPPAGPAVHTSRSDASPPDAFGSTSPTSTCRRRRSTAGRPMLAAEAVRRSRCASRPNGRPPYTRNVSNAARPLRRPSSSARMTGSLGSTRPRPVTASARTVTRAPPRERGIRSRSSSGRAFVHDSSTSVAESESQTMPPPTQRWIVSSATAKVRMVSARSKSPFP